MTDFIGSIGHALWDAVLPGLGSALVGMAMLVLKRYLAKQGIELTQKQEERLVQIAVEKIHATNEVARRIEKEGNAPLTSVEKNAKTVNDVIVAATDDPTIPNPSVEKVAAVVDAELGKARAGYMPDPGRPGLGRI